MRGRSERPMDGSSRKRVKTEQDIQDSDADLQAQTMPVLARSDDGDLSAALRFCHAELQEEGVSFPSSFGRMLSAAAAMRCPRRMERRRHACIFESLVGLRKLGSAILSQLPSPYPPPLDAVCLLEIMKALAVFVDDENKYHEMYSAGRGGAGAAYEPWKAPSQTEEVALKKSFEKIHMKLLKSMLLTPSFWSQGVTHFVRHLEQGEPAPAVRGARRSLFQLLEQDKNLISSIIQMIGDAVSMEHVGRFFRILIKESKLLEEHVTALWDAEEASTAFEMLRVDILCCLLDTEWSIPDDSECSILEFAEWVDNLQGIPVGEELKILSLIKKLAIIDKTGVMGHSRVFQLCWKHSASLPMTTIMEGFKEIFQHCKSMDDTLHKDGELEFDIMKNGEGSVMEVLKKADTGGSVNSYALNMCETDKDKLWEEEKNVFFEKCNKRLHKFLEYRLPVTRSDIGWESLHRAKLVQALQTGVQADLSAARLEVMEKLELKTLNTLYCESVSHLQVDNKLNELSKQQKILFSELNDKQHREMMQFFEDCQTNRENIVKEVLYKKARVLACVEEGKKPVDESLSKYLHAAVGLLKEDKEKQKILLQKLEEAKEKMPSSECALCMLGWTNQIRACYPCGHASVEVCRMLVEVLRHRLL
ncbi:hypothetical protein CY35_07G036800 [Sphagnum magellanicum]|uniref:Uncharacterized protein n=1 Tax=Sphagnum magellanicum TaxID=128215 RepID=A0ACB8HLF9_9BRYO|nr:hypothetical protein CY35_07G036800 [Sphagnum magellanicum]